MFGIVSVLGLISTWLFPLSSQLSVVGKCFLNVIDPHQTQTKMYKIILKKNNWTFSSAVAFLLLKMCCFTQSLSGYCKKL